jgi:hypothetical protein
MKNAFISLTTSLFTITLLYFFTSASNAQVPMNQRDPFAGVWISYPQYPLSQYQNLADIKGAMAYGKWRDLYVTNTSFNWNTIDSNLNKIIKDSGKKAFIDVAGGYCTDNDPATLDSNDWPQFLKDRIARRNSQNPQKCYPLQFWDPLYLAYNASTNTYSGYYWDYIKALAIHLADYDKNLDGHPTTTDITIVRAMQMADTMENLPNETDLANGLWQAVDFVPAPNGRIYQVDLT